VRLMNASRSVSPGGVVLLEDVDVDDSDSCGGVRGSLTFEDLGFSKSCVRE
jgi:hypothetical protein